MEPPSGDPDENIMPYPCELEGVPGRTGWVIYAIALETRCRVLGSVSPVSLEALRSCERSRATPRDRATAAAHRGSGAAPLADAPAPPP